jgi:hypothetical protein
MASPFDLVSLADLKTWLDIAGSDDDALLARLITQISRAILNIIDKPGLLPQTYIDTYDGANEPSLLLRQWPVISIISSSVDGVTIPSAPPLVPFAPIQHGYLLDSAAAAPPGAMQRLSLRGYVFTSGLQNVMISYTAGYQITNEIATVPTAPPFTVLAQAPYGNWASDAGASYADGAPLVSVTSAPNVGQYSVMNGVYSFAPADGGSSVFLSYGYVPADLACCCLDWAAERYAYRSRIGQHSKALGGQETISYIVKDIPDFAARALAPYQRVVMP